MCMYMYMWVLRYTSTVVVHGVGGLGAALGLPFAPLPWECCSVKPSNVAACKPDNVEACRNLFLVILQALLLVRPPATYDWEGLY